MAEDPSTYQSSTVQANRNLMQGGGSGQKDMDLQQSPNRDQHATDPQNTEGWDNDAPSSGAGEGDFSVSEERSFEGGGQDDNPEADWGEAAEGAVFSSNHTKRAERTEADRGQGPKTRQLNKDINSGRG